jgi:hypothetical protein
MKGTVMHAAKITFVIPKRCTTGGTNKHSTDISIGVLPTCIQRMHAPMMHWYVFTKGTKNAVRWHHSSSKKQYYERMQVQLKNAVSGNNYQQMAVP